MEDTAKLYETSNEDDMQLFDIDFFMSFFQCALDAAKEIDAPVDFQVILAYDEYRGYQFYIDACEEIHNFVHSLALRDQKRS